MHINPRRLAGMLTATVVAATLVAAQPAGAVPVRPATSATQPITATVVAGVGFHSCAILHDSTVKCWGHANYGQLGYGDTTRRGDGSGEMGDNLPAVDLGTGRTAKFVAPGENHTCAVLDNDTVKCWGLNGNGQLGYGDTAVRGDGANEMGDNLPAVDLGTGRTAVALAVGAYSSCALLDNATVKCWGSNSSGQLGYGDTASRGNEANEMGDNLQPVSLGTGRTATAISSSAYDTCALLDNGTVKCWGNNEAGQLGYGDTANRGDGSGEMGDNLSAVDLGTGRTAKAIAASYGHTCALLDNDTVKCWGLNNYGQLGYGDTNNRGDGSGEMGDNLGAVALGTGRTVKKISTGAYHTCVLLDNSTSKCWGRNENGQLGYGDTNNRGDGSGEMGDNLGAVALGTGRTATAIAAAIYHTCALLDSGLIKCWGWNDLGQLGYGDANWRGDGSGEMGDNLPAVDLGTEPALPATGTDPFVLVTLAALLLAVGTALLTSRRRTIGVR